VNPLCSFVVKGFLFMLRRQVHTAADLVALDRFEEGRENCPQPNPSLPLRWMISKKIGPITVSVKILQQQPLPLRRGAVDQDLSRLRRARSSP